MFSSKFSIYKAADEKLQVLWDLLLKKLQNILNITENKLIPQNIVFVCK